MPCSCFGKKDKKGDPLKNEEERYRPRDSKERDPPIPAGPGLNASPKEGKQKVQQQQQLGAAPQTPGTPPSTPSGDARLRPEDDADKATRRRDVVASFYSDQCELIGFKATGSRPPSAHVGGHHDGPAATSSPATSSPSSTRSGGACCRADLAEKRREFFKELAIDDFSRGSRPTSRLTDPGSQQTPRNSHYQEQLHHTLPHNKYNKVANHPLVLQQGIHRKSPPVNNSKSEEKQPLLHSSSSPEQIPKILRKNHDLPVSIPNHRNSNDITDKTPLLLDNDNEEDTSLTIDTSISTTVQKLPPEILQNSVHLSSYEAENNIESKNPELLIDISPTEVTVSQFEVEPAEAKTVLTEPLESTITSNKSVVNSPEFISDVLVSENSKLVEPISDLKSEVHVVEETTENPQLTIESSCNGRLEMDVNMSVPESQPFISSECVSEDSPLVVDNSHLIFSSTNIDPFAQFETPSVEELYSKEDLIPAESHDNQFDVELSKEPQTIGFEAFMEPHPREYEDTSLEVAPQLEDGPQTIVETTRQFISASSEIPNQPKDSQTIVETTRHFITGPPGEETTKTIVETTQQFMPESPSEQKSSHTIVETTRHFISGIPEDEESQLFLEDAAQQFLSGGPTGQTVVESTQQYVSGSPDEQITTTVIRTTQHLISESPDEQIVQTVVESSDPLFPSSTDNFFLTSVEEPDELPEKHILQTGTTTVTTTTVTEKPVPPTRTEFTDLSEEGQEEPQLPDVPCFGAPPPPPSPPPPLLEGQYVEDPFASPTPLAEHSSQQTMPPILEEQIQPVESSSAVFTPPPQLDIQLEEEELTSMSMIEDVHQPLPSAPSPPPPMENEQLPSTPTTPPREDDLPPAPPTPPTEKKMEESALSTSISTTTTITSTPTCGVEIVSSSTLEDDGIGSEIDDVLESIEGLSEEELVNIMAGELASLVARLETAVERLEKVGSVPGKSGAGGGGGSAGAPMLNSQAQEEECTVPYVLAYDDLLSGPFKIFMDCSNQIGGDVAAIAKLVQETFINQRAFLVMTSKSQRPLDTELPQVLEPTGKKIQEVIAFRESKRQSTFFNHLSAVSESIPGLSWVAVAPAPGPYVKEMGDSAIFYTNRVLKEYREKDKLHVEWVQNWNNVFKELQSYVLAHHTTGLSWNTRGGNAMNNLKPAPANCGVPPPPPPGNIPPPPPMVKLEPKVIPADDGRAALFESINKGTDITSGLKKVTDDMKTHKNPSLREGPKPFVKANATPGAPTSFSKEPSPPVRPPKLALEGKKWYVEYQQDKPNLLISQTRMDQCIYIFRCVNTVVQIKGKVNSVILDSCKKSSVVFDNLVSSAEVVNCQSCQVQVMGVMPTLSIEKTDGCQVYLSKDSLKTEIISAKSTAMNILIPNDEGDFTECPIPEQFKTLVNGLSLTTTCTEAAG